MKLTSVRTRLMLWNMGVLAVVLVGFAEAIHYTAEANLRESVDRDLAQMARHTERMWASTSGVGWPFPLPGAGPPPGPPPGPPSLGGAPSRPLLHDGPPPWWRPEFRSWRHHGFESDDPRPNGFRPVRLLDLRRRALSPFSDSGPWDAQTFGDAAAGRAVYSTITLDQVPVRVFSMPLERHGKIDGVIQVAHPLAELRQLFHGLGRTLLALVPLALLAAGIGGAFLTDRALRPVRQIIRAAEEVGATELSRRLPVAGDDEFAELASTFNSMLGRLEAAFSSLQLAYDQQRRFTGDASHELRTPLTTIKANTSLALRGQRSPVDYREALAAVDQAADLMTRMVQDLLLLARSDSGQMDLDPRPTCIAAVLESALALATPGAEAAVARLDLPAALWVLGDGHSLTRLFMNLLENALRHTPVEGSIVAAARAEGGEVVVQVRDTGEGIPPEHLPHVAERFYRVDAARSRVHGGTGLGLSICRSIVEAHAGRLIVESQLGRGTTVTVALPACEPPAQPSPLRAITHDPLDSRAMKGLSS